MCSQKHDLLSSFLREIRIKAPAEFEVAEDAERIINHKAIQTLTLLLCYLQDFLGVAHNELLC